MATSNPEFFSFLVIFSISEGIIFPVFIPRIYNMVKGQSVIYNDLVNVFDWKVVSYPPKKTKNWLLIQLAKNRGLATKKSLDEFLNPKFEQILSVTVSDITKAIARMDNAIKKGEKL